MNKEFLNLIKLFSCGVQNKPLDSFSFDLKTVRRFAIEQNVWPAVFVSVKNFYNEGRCEIPTETFQKLNSGFIAKCVSQLNQTENIKNLLRELKQNGVECVWLKGETLAKLYAYPETRTFGDADILVNPDDEQKALDFLKSKGFTVNHRTDSANHSECVSEKYGVIELHISLYYRQMNEIWFNSEDMLKEPYIDCGDYKSLGFTDGFLFCFLHAVKHFLSNGLSLRQVIDVLLYIKNYNQRIDWERVLKILGGLKYKDFLFSLIGIGVEYMGFSLEELLECSWQNDHIELILNDILECGNFGKNKHFGNDLYQAYSEKRYKACKDEGYDEYVTRDRRKNAAKMVSFSPKNLRIHYSYAKKSNWLLPIAALNHIFFLFKKVIKKPQLLAETISYKNAKKELSGSVRRKLETIQKLGMI